MDVPHIRDVNAAIITIREYCNAHPCSECAYRYPYFCEFEDYPYNWHQTFERKRNKKEEE